ncbi:uncharacterized protein E0L32_000325 [Thyridium curvatum]|uniref:Uncharacterized protein n=1 Tax=Thyridium curvatum TaxID=1093900 RepID=A0A507BG78_9PEZI|nr:uncharacterized protein E0L32_000325 [Thyridium curvatum]TPX15991.1 hypothetical protein E0L32_000325 [Thyridium curvatum]
MRPTSAALCLVANAALAAAFTNWDLLTHPVVPGFRWQLPFPDDGTHPGGYDVPCQHTETFRAKAYRLGDLRREPPRGLAPWADALDVFLAHREYPGSWDGVDHGGDSRELLVMEYADVPPAVRGWVELQAAGQGAEQFLFGVFEKPRGQADKVRGTVRVKPTTTTAAAAAAAEGEEPWREIPDQDKIMVFAPAAVYPILPLWVAKGSKCEGEFVDLAKYKRQVEDNAVVAWPISFTKPEGDEPNRDASFTIKAMHVTETDHGKTMRLMWEKLHRTVRRSERKLQKEQRAAAARDLRDDTRVRDEL